MTASETAGARSKDRRATRGVATDVPQESPLSVSVTPSPPGPPPRTPLPTSNRRPLFTMPTCEGVHAVSYRPRVSSGEIESRHFCLVRGISGDTFFRHDHRAPVGGGIPRSLHILRASP